MPWDSYDSFGEDLGWKFWLSTRDFLISGLERLGQVANRLADQESRNILLGVVAFRLGLDLSFSSYQSSENQYFNSMTLPALKGKEINYVDCGAYVGDTYFDLIKQEQILCKNAFLFEPDRDNFLVLQHNVSDQDGRAICLPLAVADTYKILTFSSGQGEGGAIGPGGDVSVAAAALDQILPQKHIDLIKLDVEGAEALALKGMRKIIGRSRPVLTLSLYHNPQDLWELPELLFEMCPDYDFLMRQHYFNSFELVLYAVPRLQ